MDASFYVNNTLKKSIIIMCMALLYASQLKENNRNPLKSTKVHNLFFQI